MKYFCTFAQRRMALISKMLEKTLMTLVTFKCNFDFKVLEKSVSMMENFQGGEEVFQKPFFLNLFLNQVVFQKSILLLFLKSGGSGEASLKASLNDRMREPGVPRWTDA